MRKLFPFVIALLCVASAFADNDILIKLNSEKIEAIIEEVSDTEVKYKKANNPAGPTYILSLTEVATIVYANGDVQAIEQKPEQSYGNTGYVFKQEPMTRDGKIYYYHGKPMDQKQFVEFIKANCDRAYQHYLKNRKLERAGWALFGVGMALTITGSVLGPCAYTWYNEGYGKNWETIAAAGLGIGISGVVIVGGVSVPMICVGNVRKMNSHKQYNTWCGDRDQASNMEMRLTFGANGLGLAIAF